MKLDNLWFDSLVKIASELYYGKRDKGGKPYIFHAMNVMIAQEDIVSQAAGLAHDLVEDELISYRVAARKPQPVA